MWQIFPWHGTESILWTLFTADWMVHLVYAASSCFWCWKCCCWNTSIYSPTPLGCGIKLFTFTNYTFTSEQDKKTKPLQPDFCSELMNFFSARLQVEQEVLGICRSNLLNFLKKSYLMESEQMFETQAAVFQCHRSIKFYFLLFIFTPDLIDM